MEAVKFKRNRSREAEVVHAATTERAPNEIKSEKERKGGEGEREEGESQLWELR